MNAARRALEALLGIQRGSDDTPVSEEALIEAGVDPDEAKILVMEHFTDKEKEHLIAHLRQVRREVAAGRATKRYTREQFADELEASGSVLCDCDDPDGNPPTNPHTEARMDHHCECAAVRASATVRRGESVTRHGRDCGCLVVDNQVREGLGLGPLGEDARVYQFDRRE